jgi:hypothetical protein
MQEPRTPRRTCECARRLRHAKAGQLRCRPGNAPTVRGSAPGWRRISRCKATSKKRRSDRGSFGCRRCAGARPACRRPGQAAGGNSVPWVGSLPNHSCASWGSLSSVPSFVQGHLQDPDQLRSLGTPRRTAAKALLEPVGSARPVDGAHDLRDYPRASPDSRSESRCPAELPSAITRRPWWSSWASNADGSSVSCVVHDDCLVRGTRRPAVAAVRVDDAHVRAAEACEGVRRALRACGVDFGRNDFAGRTRKATPPDNRYRSRSRAPARCR